MEINKAIDRFIWRFKEASKKDNSFFINDNDLEALKSIVSYVEQAKKEVFNANPLFAKLYIWELKNLLDRGIDISKEEGKKWMQIPLKMSLQQVVEEFQNSLTLSELYFTLKPANEGIDIPDMLKHVHSSRYEDYISDEVDSKRKLEMILNWKNEKKKQREKLSQLLKDKPDLFQDAQFDFETAQDIGLAEVNQMIENYGRIK